MSVTPAAQAAVSSSRKNTPAVIHTDFREAKPRLPAGFEQAVDAKP
jgi:hypothetical protein